jgi:hypothetical protein
VTAPPRQFNWQKEPEGEPPRRKGRSRIRLATADDVASELRRLHRRVERGELTATEALRQARVLSQLSQVLTAASIETRLAKIEAENEKRKRR